VVAPKYNERRKEGVKHWGSKIVRIIGIANIIVGTLGLCFLAWTLLEFIHRKPHPAGLPYFIPAYYAMTTMSIGYLLLLVLAGFWLKSLHRKGYILSLVVYSAEIAYFLAIGALGAALSGNASQMSNAIDSSVSGAYGIGNIGLAPQLITGYPLIAFFAVILAVRKLKKDGGGLTG
jgi:hypothetical protein